MAVETDVNQYITYPTWKKMLVLSSVVDSFQIRQKRLVFHTMRTHPNTTHDTFFPEFGMTAGIFCTWQILSDTRRTRIRSNRSELDAT